MTSDVIRRDVDQIRNTPAQLEETLQYGKNEAWELSMDKVKPRKFLDDEFVRFYTSVHDASKKKALATRLLPKMQTVLETSKEGKATVYKAVELMETMDPLVQYSYTAEDYNFQLDGRCRRILDQYDSTYKEMIVYRSKSDMDKVETKTGECLKLLEDSIQAAEEDVNSWTEQKEIEDKRIGHEDVKEKNSIAQDLIREENDELKLIEHHCKEDIETINKKLGELDTELNDVRMERNKTQEKLNGKLQRNRSEQHQLRERLSMLEDEDRQLTGKIQENNKLQTDANKEYEMCQEQVREIQKKIFKLLEMTNASIQLMQDMTDCVNEIVHTAREEKQRVLKDLERKELHSNLQLRDTLMAKIVFHRIQTEEVTHNLQDTRRETEDMQKELRSASKVGAKSKVTRLKDTISTLEAEENSYAEKKDYHEKELNTLQERCEQLDKKIHTSGIPRLPTVEERVKKWKAEQDKCFDNPDTGQFHSNLSRVQQH